MWTLQAVLLLLCISHLPFFSFFSARSLLQDSISFTTWKCSLMPSFKIHYSDNQLTSSSGHARVQKVQWPTKTASFGYFPVLPESVFLKLYKFQVYDQRLIFYPCERVARSPWNLASTEIDVFQGYVANSGRRKV